MNHTDTTSTNRVLWFGFLSGPTAWTVHELVSYLLVGVACGTGRSIVLHLVSLACLALAAAGAYVAYRGRVLETPRNAADVLAVAGVLLNGLFAFAIIMESLPSLVVSPCL